jgi:DNA repair exonuclease SbcCD ATPase subunit
MRLIRVKPSFFRGFADSEWINIDADLVVIYGPNGFGKTSLAEAIEWLLYGKTKRREKGENLSQRDYQGSYRNIHAPVGSQTKVEAEFRHSDGTTHVLRRELVLGRRNAESSETFVNNSRADFSTVGITQEEIYYPIIAQHSLQDFIHSRPIDRRDKISAALGLDILVRFKSVVDRGRTRFQNNPTPAVNIAKAEVNKVTRIMEQSTNLRQMAARWNSSQIDIVEDVKELMNCGINLVGEGANGVNNLLEELANLRSEISKSIFRVNSIKPNLDYDNISENVGIEELKCKAEARLLATKFKNCINSVVEIYSLEQTGFWETGLSIGGSESDFCPFCEQSTLTADKRNELKSRIIATRGYKNALTELENQSKVVGQNAIHLIELLRSSLPALLNEQEHTILVKLFGESPEPCNIFLQAHDSTRTIINQLITSFTNRQQNVQTLHEMVQNPESVQQAREVVDSLEHDIENFCLSGKNAAQNYINAYNQFEHELLNRISSEDSIKEIDAVMAPLASLKQITVLSHYYALLNDSLGLLRQIEEHIQIIQSRLFNTRGQEISLWYDMMNPGASVRYCRMEAGTDSITLWAQSFGVDMNAVSCLSQCQLNCLGLSVNLMRVTTTGTPYNFLIMDDPVQSMDDDHCQALICSVINDLLSNRNLQVIVFSHVQGMVDAIRDLYYNLQPIRLRISDFEVNQGPIIELDESLQQALIRARALARGNEENRRLAVKVVRRCVELLIRETCRSTNSTPPPDNATANNMVPYFRTCNGTTPQQAQGLQQTIHFSDPGPHTQVGWPVPIESQILPHIQRMEQVAQALMLF